MSDDVSPLVAELEKLGELLERAERNAERRDPAEAYRAALTQVQGLMKTSTLTGPTFQRLSRFVDDSLPWNEELLGCWQRVQGMLREQRS